MKNRLFALGASVMATGLFTLAGAAEAQTSTGTPPSFSTIFSEGNFDLPAYTTASVFQNFAGAPTNTQYAPGANESVTGVVQVMEGTVPGTSVQPTGSTTNRYLDIVNGSYGVTFAAPVQFFSFILGSLDSYNSVKLSFANGATETLTGTQIIGMTGTGPLNSPYYGRVSFDLGGGSGITGALFSSTQAALEIDSLAAAVPEMSTWAMMMVGLGVVGGALRRRQVKVAGLAVA